MGYDDVHGHTHSDRAVPGARHGVRTRAGKGGITALAASLALTLTIAVTGTSAAAASSCIGGGDLQQQLNSRGQGATVCLSGTVHGNIRPLQGQTVTGGHVIGSIDMHAGNVTVRNVEVSGSTIGVRCGNRSTITGSYIHDNTWDGIACGANQDDWFIRITDNRIIHNGSTRMEGYTAGGVKLLALSKPGRPLGAGATVTGNTVVNNYGNGLWLDRSSSASIVSNNVVHDNTRHGFRCEKCGGPIEIRNNTLYHNGYDGIDITSTGVATLSGNTTYNNGYRQRSFGITVHEDWRAKKVYPTLGDVTMGWHIYRIVLSNNHAKDGLNGCSHAKVAC